MRALRREAGDPSEPGVIVVDSSGVRRTSFSADVSDGRTILLPLVGECSRKVVGQALREAPLARRYTLSMETVRLLFFTALWTAVWAAPLPKLSRRVELVAGLIPFAAFGLRVFAACFIGVPEDDPVRRTVAPLVDWVNGVSGVLPYQWVLDVTVAIGLVWLASIAGIPRWWRLATIWVMPAVALASLASLHFTGLPLERLLAPWWRS